MNTVSKEDLLEDLLEALGEYQNQRVAFLQGAEKLRQQAQQMIDQANGSAGAIKYIEDTLATLEEIPPADEPEGDASDGPANKSA